MEKLLANAAAEDRLVLLWLYGVLFVAGAVIDILLIRHDRRHPPDRAALTAAMVSRAWSTVQTATVFGTLLLLYFLASFSGRLFFEEDMAAARLAITLLIYAIILTLIGLINRRRCGSWLGSDGIMVTRVRPLLLSPLFYLAVLPLLLLASTGYQALLKYAFDYEAELQEVARIAAGPVHPLLILYMLTAIFAAPVYEELLFRGILFPFLLKQAGLPAATVMVALVFALMHFHIPSFLPLFILSCALSLAYWRTGSLRVCIGMHALFNAVSFLALMIAASGAAN